MIYVLCFSTLDATCFSSKYRFLDTQVQGGVNTIHADFCDLCSYSTRDFASNCCADGSFWPCRQGDRYYSELCSLMNSRCPTFRRSYHVNYLLILSWRAGKGPFNHSHLKHLSRAVLATCDPGWYVHKLQSKWMTTHVHTHTHTHTQAGLSP